MATTTGHRLTLDPMGKCSNAFFSEVDLSNQKINGNESKFYAFSIYESQLVYISIIHILTIEVLYSGLFKLIVQHQIIDY